MNFANQISEQEQTMVVVNNDLIRQLRGAVGLSRAKFCYEAIRLNHVLESTNLRSLEVGRTNMAFGNTLLAIADTLRTVATRQIRAIEAGRLEKPSEERLQLLHQAFNVDVETLMKREVEAVA